GWPGIRTWFPAAASSARSPAWRRRPGRRRRGPRPGDCRPRGGRRTRRAAGSAARDWTSFDSNAGNARRRGQAAHSTRFLVTAAMTPRDRWIVLKFGGTSVSRRERWDTIGGLAHERSAEGARVLVVVSALSGVTNALQAACQGDD